MRNRALIGGLATAVVVALVVAGLFAIGSPATARKFKADQERRNRLGQIHYVLSGTVRDEGSLPRSLEEIENEVLVQVGYGGDVRKDPETGEFFEYRRESNRGYEICATFETSSEDRRGQEFGPYPGDIGHEAGRTCFEREVTDQDVESAPMFGFEEAPSRPLPPKMAPSETARPATEPTSSTPVTGPVSGPTDAPALGDPGTRSASPDPSPSSV